MSSIGDQRRLCLLRPPIKQIEMSILEIVTVITGLVPYALLVIGILKGTVKQSFATWILWLALDGIVLRGIIVQHGSPILFSVFTFGTLIVTIVLIVKKQFAWGKFESFVAFLVGVCIAIYLTSGAYMATIATTAALSIAGIPQVIDTYKNPHQTSTTAYLLFTISSLLAIIGADAWTVPDRLPQTNSFGFCIIIMLLSLKKKNNFATSRV